MATVKTVKPAGGGDYTTLALWWTFAAAQATADQWAECYNDGSSLGSATISAMTATPDANNYPRIYAASGHEATNFTNGALLSFSTSGSGNALSISVSYTRVEGLRFSVTHSGGAPHNGVNVPSSIDNVTVKNCVYAYTSGVGASTALRFNANTGCRVLNCLIKSSRHALKTSGPNSAFTNEIIGNTLHATGVGTALELLSSANGSSSLPTYTVKNNVFMSVAGSGVVLTDTNGVTETFVCGNNASTDGTANSVLGGSGNDSSIVIATEFTDTASNDYTIKTTSVLRRTGILTSVTDSLNFSIPRHSPPDKGAYESAQIGPTGGMGTLLMGVS